MAIISMAMMISDDDDDNDWACKRENQEPMNTDFYAMIVIIVRLLRIIELFDHTVKAMSP